MERNWKPMERTWETLEDLGVTPGINCLFDLSLTAHLSVFLAELAHQHHGVVKFFW